MEEKKLTDNKIVKAYKYCVLDGEVISKSLVDEICEELTEGNG